MRINNLKGGFIITLEELRTAVSCPFKPDSLCLKTVKKSKAQYVTMTINGLEFRIVGGNDVTVANLLEILYLKKERIHVRAHVSDIKRTYSYFLRVDEEDRVVLEKK